MSDEFGFREPWELRRNPDPGFDAEKRDLLRRAEAGDAEAAFELAEMLKNARLLTPEERLAILRDELDAAKEMLGSAAVARLAREFVEPAGRRSGLRLHDALPEIRAHYQREVQRAAEDLVRMIGDDIREGDADRLDQMIREEARRVASMTIDAQEIVLAATDLPDVLSERITDVTDRSGLRWHEIAVEAFYWDVETRLAQLGIDRHDPRRPRTGAASGEEGDVLPCSDCGTTLPVDELAQTPDGDAVCNVCFRQRARARADLVLCPRCGARRDADDIARTPAGEALCFSCYTTERAERRGRGRRRGRRRT